MSSLTRLLPLIFIILANLFAAANAQTNCGTRGNYTIGSTYQSNLNSLLSSLSRNVDENGFYNASVGENSDRAYALVLCRGDQQLDTCRSCIQNATVDLVRTCPNQRRAIFWNELCMLRYSDQSMFRNLTISPAANVFIQRNASSPNQFNADRRILLQNLWGQAANGSSLRKVAAMSRPSADFQTIYAMMQCTPDLTSEECTTCLTGAAQQLPRCCESRTFARIVRPSCNLIYNIEPFYNNSRLLELAQTPVAPTPGTGDNNTTRIIIIIAVSASVGVILIIIVGYVLRKRVKKKAYEASEMDEISKAESLQYEFDKIRAATNNFSEANKLGQGGFGSVYRGKLVDGQEIAVKRLSCDSCQGDLEFKNEVTLLAKLQHRNLVRLLGFCLERTEKILVYEFLQNASLDRFIFGPKRFSNLDWGTRYEIIWGIVKGILYLHEDSRLRIIHRDLKASNILLDEDMNPKIADFGTARLFVRNETRANTSRIVGTFGYMAPEYAMHGQFSVKSDVFSFGVLVLEIISGQRNNRFHENGRDGEDLITRAAWRNWQEKTVSNLIDPSLKGSSGIPQDILRCIHIGLLCVQQNAGDRPTMASVVQMLNSSFTSTLPVPSKPAYFVASDYDLDASLTHGYNSRDTDDTSLSMDPYVHDYSI